MNTPIPNEPPRLLTTYLRLSSTLFTFSSSGYKESSNLQKLSLVEYNGSPGPMTDLNMSQEDVEKANEVFYGKFLETINKMC